jgi:hypothetical protein
MYRRQRRFWDTVLGWLCSGHERNGYIVVVDILLVPTSQYLDRFPWRDQKV